MKHLKDFGFGKVGLHGVIQAEADEVVRHLTQFHGRDFKMESVFGIPVINILWNIVAGRRFEREDVRVKTVMDGLRCDKIPN